MPPAEGAVLRLASDGGGWRRGGAPWTPPRPFYAVLGNPVSRSLSPRFQGAALRAAGLPFDYRAVEADPGELPLLRERGEALGLRGLNVTAPFKQAAAGLCDALSPEASSAGAVNTLRWRGGSWEGHNTDVGGIAARLRAEGALPEAAVVLGAGGSARAAVLALVRSGVARVWVAARPGPSRTDLERWLDASGADLRAAVVVTGWDAKLAALPTPADTAVVACVPVAADVAPLLAPPPARPPRYWLDLRYGLPCPPAVAALGVPWRDGRGVLLEQGALSFEWWFGGRAPRAVMASALDLP